MGTPTRDTVLSELRLLEKGIQKNMMSATVTIASVTYSGPELVARLEECINAVLGVRNARAALVQALAVEESTLGEAHEFLVSLRQTILRGYSNAHTTLNDFGLEPPKTRRAMTAEEGLLRAAKAKATREKRGTLGKRQRAAIKGTVTGVVITPVVRDDAKD